MSDPLADGITLGIYEKALVGNALSDGDDWRTFLEQVPSAGFSYLDISIDETPEREARLEWDAAACRTVREAASDVGTDIGGVCLSIHRKIGPGSADPEVRAHAREVMARGLQVCHDLGAPVIQLAGYYAYYEEPNPDAERWYGELLADAVPLAARLGVVMGIENVDGNDVTSIRKAMEFVDRSTPRTSRSTRTSATSPSRAWTPTSSSQPGGATWSRCTPRTFDGASPVGSTWAPASSTGTTPSSCSTTSTGPDAS